MAGSWFGVCNDLLILVFPERCTLLCKRLSGGFGLGPSLPKVFSVPVRILSAGYPGFRQWQTLPALMTPLAGLSSSLAAYDEAANGNDIHLTAMQ